MSLEHESQNIRIISEDHVTLKTVVMTAESSVFQSQELRACLIKLLKYFAIQF